MKKRHVFIIFALCLLIAIPQQTFAKRRPVIGLTVTLKNNNQTLGNDYVRAVINAGGVPYLIPTISDDKVLDQIVSQLDGMLFTGGPDVNPARYGAEPHPQLGEVNEARDTFELKLFQKVYAKKLPIYGICRGMQVINVALGGTLYQDIPSDFPTSELNHKMTGKEAPEIAHSIDVLPNTKSAEVLGSGTLQVNSRHHQCVEKVGKGIRITAYAPDGVVEMMECYPERAILCTQFHPEIHAVRFGNKNMSRFFDSLISEAKKYMKKKKK